MPCSVPASWMRTWSCCSAGKTSMTRSIVIGALWVCRVAKTRWPVSAAVSAVAIVSRSRISPTRMTSGSWRSAARSASENDGVSKPTSRWLTMHIRCSCRNSIGSSIVRMCSERVRLTWSISAASVVDLPEPVGPVTRTSPRGLSASPSMCWRKAELRERPDLGRDHAEGRAERATLEEDVDAQAADARGSSRPCRCGGASRAPSAARSRGSGRAGRASPRESAVVVLERLELSAPANHRLRLGGEMEVRGVEILHLPHEIIDREGRHRSFIIGSAVVRLDPDRVTTDPAPA